MFTNLKELFLCLSAISLAACQQPDPKIHGAYAISTDLTNPLGSDVLPDRFEIRALVSSQVEMQVGDTFSSSFNVGVAGAPSKYGGSSGIRWHIVDTYPHGVAPSLVPLPNDRFLYRAVSQQLGITCDAQNRLMYSVPGDSRDELRFTLQTAAMPRLLGVRLGDHSIGLPPPWPSTAPNQPDGNYIAAPETRTFHCLVEDRDPRRSAK